VCQLNVSKDIDPRKCILRRTKEYERFTQPILAVLHHREIETLRTVCGAMLIISFMERPDKEYRDKLRWIARETVRKRAEHAELLAKRNDLNKQMSKCVPRRDLVNKRMRLQELTQTVLHSVIREEAKKASFTGHCFVPYFSKEEIEAADEIRAIKSQHALDDAGNLALPEITKTRINEQLIAVRSQLVDKGVEIANLFQEQTVIKQKKLWKANRINRVAEFCGITHPVTGHPINIKGKDIVDPELKDVVVHVLTKAVDWCACVLFDLIKSITQAESYFIERVTFWNILMCYNMCVLAKVRFHEVLQTDDYTAEQLVNVLLQIWSIKAIMKDYPDFRFQCPYTIGRLFQLRSLFYHDYGVNGKVSDDIFMQLVRSFTPQKYQFERSCGITERLIREDHDSMAIPFLVSVIVFFKIGLYYQSTICAEDDWEYGQLIDLYSRRYKLHSKAAVFTRYLDYVVSFFTSSNFGMAVVATNEYITRNFFFNNGMLDQINPCYRICRLQVETVCDAWRKKRCRGSGVADVIRTMQFLRSQMAFHREAMQNPVDFLMMVFHRNILKTEEGEDADDSGDNNKSKSRRKRKTPSTKPEPLDNEEPEPFKIIVKPDDPDEMDRALKEDIESAGANSQMRLALLGKRSYKIGVIPRPSSSTSDRDAPPSNSILPQEKQNRSSVSLCLTKANLDRSNEVFADLALGVISGPKFGAFVNYNGAQLNRDWFSFLVRSPSIYDHAAEIGAIMASQKVLPHEEEALRICNLTGQPARRFLSTWRFFVLMAWPMGMTADDEFMFLLALHDFCKQLGPSTLLLAARKACIVCPIISYVALLWKRFTNFTWGPLPTQIALVQHKSITRRLQIFNIPHVKNLEHLVFCPVCGLINTIHNGALKINSSDEVQVVDGQKVMGFTWVKVCMLPLKKVEAMCARVGLAVSKICQGTRVLYVPTRYRIVWRTEQNQQWRVCGCCGILSMRDCETWFALSHPLFGELCSSCSLKWSRVRHEKDKSVFQYEAIPFTMFPGLKQMLVDDDQEEADLFACRWPTRGK